MKTYKATINKREYCLYVLKKSRKLKWFIQQGKTNYYTLFKVILSYLISDPSSLCSTFDVDDYKWKSKWKPDPWTVFPANYDRVFNYENWFKAEKDYAIPTSCVQEERCGAQAPGWFSGSNPSREAGIIHGKACFNFRKDCCYYSLPMQIKKCRDFFVYKLKEVHPIIPGQYCFTISTLGMLLITLSCMVMVIIQVSR